MALFTVEEAAKVLGVEPETINKEVQTGALNAVTVNEETGESRIELDVEEEGIRVPDDFVSPEHPLFGNLAEPPNPILLSPIGYGSKREEGEREGTADEEKGGARRPRLRRRGKRSSSTRRLNVVFSESAYDELQQMSDRSGKSISDVVRDALKLQQWFDETRKGGGRILVEERGRIRETLNIR